MTFVNRTTGGLSFVVTKDPFVLPFLLLAMVSYGLLFVAKQTTILSAVFLGIIIVSIIALFFMKKVQVIPKTFPSIVLMLAICSMFVLPSAMYVIGGGTKELIAEQILICGWETMFFGAILPKFLGWIIKKVFRKIDFPANLLLGLLFSNIGFTLLHVLSYGFTISILVYIFVLGFIFNGLAIIFPSLGVGLHFINNVIVYNAILP